MGRGVEYIGDDPVFFDGSELIEDYDYDDLMDNLRYALSKKYPSLEPVNKWEPRYHETPIILENDHIRVGISDYCGSGAVSIYVQFDVEYPELAQAWLEQVYDGMVKIIERFVTPLRRLGTMSNGVSVYERK